MSAITERFSNIYRLQDHKFEIIGCGSIGSFTAMNLVRAGADKFMLWDDDHVATVNIGVQHFSLSHVGNSKVKMLRKQMIDINPQALIFMYRKKYDKNAPNRLLPSVNQWKRTDINFNKKIFIIIGIDNMHGRKSIAEAISISTKYFLNDVYVLDGRMGSETFQLYHWKLMSNKAINSIMQIMNEDVNGRFIRLPVIDKIKAIVMDAGNRFIRSYLKSWYSDDAGNPEPCNARSTNYCASMAASFINNQIRKICDNNSTTDTDILFNFPQMLIQSQTSESILQ